MGKHDATLSVVYLIVLVRFTIFAQNTANSQDITKEDGVNQENKWSDLACQFKCADSSGCYTRTQLCNIARDCNDGSDEFKCAKPSIKEQPEPIKYVELGSHTELVCSADGYLPPWITWKHNGCMMPYGRNRTSSTLVINAAKYEDTGKYICNATNKMGYDTSMPSTLVVTRPRDCSTECTECVEQKWRFAEIIKKMKEKIPTTSLTEGREVRMVEAAVSLHTCDHTKECVGQLRGIKSINEWWLRFYPLDHKKCKSLEMNYSTSNNILSCKPRDSVSFWTLREPCLVAEKHCETTTDCSRSLRGVCINDINIYIKDLTNRFSTVDVPFVSTKHLILQGPCDSFGNASRPALKGIVMANFTDTTMQTFELKFYWDNSPGKLLTFNVSLGTTNEYKFNCSSVSDAQTVPVVDMSCPAPQTTESVATTTTTSATCPTVSCPTSTPTTTPTDNDGGFDALKTGDPEEKCPGSSLAIAACASFVAGVLTVLAVLFLLRCLRTRTSCFGKNDDAVSKTKEGTSQSITKQVLQKYKGEKKLPQQTNGDKKIYSQLDHDNDTGQHVYDISQDTYETLKGDGTKDTHLYSAAQSTYQSLDDTNGVKYNTGNEHVYTGLGGQTGSDISRGKPPKPQNVNTDQRNENPFDDSRDSSASAHNYFTLQNDNFRLSEPQKDRNQETAAGNRESNDGNAYFVLEKEGGSGPDAKMPPQDGGADNTYFVLDNEEGSGAQGKQQTSGVDNTYFVLEKDDGKQ